MRNLILIFVILLTGCAAGPRFNQFSDLDSSQAELYVLRQSLFGFLNAVEVAIDGKEVGELRAKGFLRLSLAPGDYVLSFPIAFWEVGNEIEVPIKVEAGQRYFYEYRSKIESVTLVPGVAGSGSASINNELIKHTEADALKILSELNES